jgi:predicted outer membrane repeat protein
MKVWVNTIGGKVWVILMNTAKAFLTLFLVVLVLNLFSTQSAAADDLDNSGENTSISVDGNRGGEDKKSDAGTASPDSTAKDMASSNQNETAASTVNKEFVVSNESELATAINSAHTSNTTTITLDRDISLTETLKIPAYRGITLKGNYRLIGADGKDTLLVEGAVITITGNTTNLDTSPASLTIDGLTVTHNPGEKGRGLLIVGYTTVVLQNGSISGNVTDGFGGGVYVSSQSSFVMNSGNISDNEATYGGGIAGASFDDWHNNNDARITIHKGTLSKNKATANGGAIHVSDYAYLTIKKAVKFSDNRSLAKHLLDKKKDPITWKAYKKGVKCTTWSNSLSVGVNNHDINYELIKLTFDCNYYDSPADSPKVTIDVPKNVVLTDYVIDNPSHYPYTFSGWWADPDIRNDLAFFFTAFQLEKDTTLYAAWVAPEYEYSVTINNSYSDTTGAGDYSQGEAVTIRAGSREGYSFAGWTIDQGDITLANAGKSTTTFTLPSRLVPQAPPSEIPPVTIFDDIIITANWVQSTSASENGRSTLPATGDNSAAAGILALPLMLVAGMVAVGIQTIRNIRHKRSL